MTLSEKQTQSSFYSAREYLIPGLFFTFFSIRIGILPYLLQLFSAFWIFRGLGKLQNHNKNLREAYALSAGLLFWQIVLLGLMVSPVAQTPFFFCLSYPCTCSHRSAHGPSASDSPRPEGNVPCL